MERFVFVWFFLFRALEFHWSIELHQTSGCVYIFSAPFHDIHRHNKNRLENKVVIFDLFTKKSLKNKSVRPFSE